MEGKFSFCSLQDSIKQVIKLLKKINFAILIIEAVCFISWVIVSVIGYHLILYKTPQIGISFPLFQNKIPLSLFLTGLKRKKLFLIALNKVASLYYSAPNYIISFIKYSTLAGGYPFGRFIKLHPYSTIFFRI